MDAKSVEAAKRAASLLKTVDGLRERRVHFAEELDDEGDRVYFGSSNHADEFKRLADDLQSHRWDEVLDPLRNLLKQIPGSEWDGCHGLDTPGMVCFYEQDFYVLSNFSSFRLRVNYGPGLDLDFDTSEAAYHYFKFKVEGDAAFNESRQSIRSAIRRADSAHDAFRIAERNKDQRRPDWDVIKVGVMRRLLHLKAAQHEYVRRKLLATGDRELVENSWRDAFWGWGPNRDGQNMLGKLWMEVRAELRAAIAATA